MIVDSGNRREFDTGAVRDIQEGKGRCDLLPLETIGKLTGNQIFMYLSEFQKSGSTVPLGIVFRMSESLFNEDFSTLILEVSKHFEDGAKKYGERNWQKGIPAHCYIDSAVRHYLKFCRGDTDERHDRAFAWNILCCIWTCDYMPELNDYSKEDSADELEEGS